MVGVANHERARIIFDNGNTFTQPILLNLGSMTPFFDVFVHHFISCSNIRRIMTSYPSSYSLPAIIVGRFILNLRQVGSTPGSSTSFSDAQSRTLHFAGNIGESLSFSESEDEGRAGFKCSAPCEIVARGNDILGIDEGGEKDEDEDEEHDDLWLSGTAGES